MSRRTQIGACAWRISREVANGTPDFNNAKGSLCVSGGITKVTHGFEVEAGQKIFMRDSCGNPMVNVVQNDIEKWVNGEITLCKDDYRIWEILGLTSNIVQAGGNVIGRAHQMAAACGVTARNPVSLELWVPQYDCDQLDSTYPYQRWIFTKAIFTSQGFDLDASPGLPKFLFKAFNNANFGDGPFGDLDTLVTNAITDHALVVLDDTAIPTCSNDYLATPSSAS